jgi:hypothetical protein
VELFIEHGKFCLNSEVLDSISLGENQLVDFSEVISFRNITESSITSFSYKKVLFLQSQFGNSFPISFSLGGKFQWFKDLDSSFESIVLQG